MKLGKGQLGSPIHHKPKKIPVRDLSIKVSSGVRDEKVIISPKLEKSPSAFSPLERIGSGDVLNSLGFPSGGLTPEEMEIFERHKYFDGGSEEKSPAECQPFDDYEDISKLQYQSLRRDKHTNKHVCRRSSQLRVNAKHNKHVPSPASDSDRLQPIPKEVGSLFLNSAEMGFLSYKQDALETISINRSSKSKSKRDVDISNFLSIDYEEDAYDEFGVGRPPTAQAEHPSTDLAVMLGEERSSKDDESSYLVHESTSLSELENISGSMLKLSSSRSFFGNIVWKVRYFHLIPLRRLLAYGEQKDSWKGSIVLTSNCTIRVVHANQPAMANRFKQLQSKKSFISKGTVNIGQLSGKKIKSPEFKTNEIDGLVGFDNCLELRSPDYCDNGRTFYFRCSSLGDAQHWAQGIQAVINAVKAAEQKIVRQRDAEREANDLGDVGDLVEDIDADSVIGGEVSRSSSPLVGPPIPVTGVADDSTVAVTDVAHSEVNSEDDDVSAVRLIVGVGDDPIVDPVSTDEGSSLVVNLWPSLPETGAGALSVAGAVFTPREVLPEDDKHLVSIAITSLDIEPPKEIVDVDPASLLEPLTDQAKDIFCESDNFDCAVVGADFRKLVSPSPIVEIVELEGIDDVTIEQRMIVDKSHVKYSSPLVAKPSLCYMNDTYLAREASPLEFVVSNDENNSVNELESSHSDSLEMPCTKANVSDPIEATSREQQDSPVVSIAFVEESTALVTTANDVHEKAGSLDHFASGDAVNTTDCAVDSLHASTSQVNSTSPAKHLLSDPQVLVWNPTESIQSESIAVSLFLAPAFSPSPAPAHPALSNAAVAPDAVCASIPSPAPTPLSALANASIAATVPAVAISSRSPVPALFQMLPSQVPSPVIVSHPNPPFSPNTSTSHQLTVIVPNSPRIDFRDNSQQISQLAIPHVVDIPAEHSSGNAYSSPSYMKMLSSKERDSYGPQFVRRSQSTRTRHKEQSDHRKPALPQFQSQSQKPRSASARNIVDERRQLMGSLSTVQVTEMLHSLNLSPSRFKYDKRAMLEAASRSTHIRLQQLIDKKLRSEDFSSGRLWSIANALAASSPSRSPSRGSSPTIKASPTNRSPTATEYKSSNSSSIPSPSVAATTAASLASTRSPSFVKDTFHLQDKILQEVRVTDIVKFIFSLGLNPEEYDYDKLAMIKAANQRNPLKLKQFLLDKNIIAGRSISNPVADASARVGQNPTALSTDSTSVPKTFDEKYKLGTVLQFGSFSMVAAIQHRNLPQQQQQQPHLQQQLQMEPLQSYNAFDHSPNSISTKNSKSGNIMLVRITNKLNASCSEIENARNENQMLQYISTHLSFVHYIEFIESQNFMYLCFERASGQNLLQLMQFKRQYDESDARSFVKQLLETIKRLHAHDILHTDLRLEHITAQEVPNLACAQKKVTYKLILTDYRFARFISSTNYSSNIGEDRHAWIAPEMLHDGLYGKPVDMWAIGCTMHVLICGYYPFQPTSSSSSPSLGGAVLSLRSQNWYNVSLAAKSLLTQLLHSIPSERLTVDQALAHPWFAMKEASLMRNILDKNLPNFSVLNG